MDKRIFTDTNPNYRIFKEIIESLNDYHYVKKEINENFSKDVLEEYLKGLDFSKTSFFSFDIAEFRKHNFSLKKIQTMMLIMRIKYITFFNSGSWKEFFMH